MKVRLYNLYLRLLKLVFSYGKINVSGKGILNFIDIGSSNGRLPEPWFKNSKHIKNLLCFDPQANGSNNRNIMVKDVGVWKEETTLPFYIYKGLHSSGSSIFQQNHEYVKTNYETLKTKGNQSLASSWFDRAQLLREEKIKVTTLDKILDNNSSKIPFDFLKVDAQGAEYEILSGAKKFLDSSCIGLHLELFKVPLYKGIKLEPEVTSFLESRGFELIKKFPSHGTFHSQNDCLYLKKEVSKDQQEKINLLKIIYELS